MDCLFYFLDQVLTVICRTSALGPFPESGAKLGPQFSQSLATKGVLLQVPHRQFIYFYGFPEIENVLLN